VSKFFKALEKVEQEREAAASAAPAPAAPEAPVAEPAARRAPEVPPKPAPRVTPPRAEPVAPTPAPRVEPAPRREPVPAPRIEPTPGPRVLTPRVEPPRLEPAPATPAPVTPAPVAPAPSPFARRPEPRPTVYGAPVARDNGDIRHGFGWQLEATDDSEAGEIDDHLVSLLEPTSFAAEQYRAVRLAIETMRHERGTRVVGISSPGRGDGKTMTALNLAGALAQAPDARVVLVEADLRHPAATRYLGLSAPRGLSSYLLDHSMNLDAVVQRPPSIAFAVVPAGAASSMPYELLKSPRLAGLLAELRQRFDFVLVDTPPALPFPDVGIVRDLVDGFVVVVRANRTPKEMLQDTMSVLGRQRTLGLVFNDDERSGVPTFQPDGDARWKRLMPRPLGARVA
jgi:protein-tyrosine kinase